MFLPHLPNCIIPIKSGIEHWVQWKLRKTNTGHIMANPSDGKIIDWSPKGDPLNKNNNLDLPILLNGRRQWHPTPVLLPRKSHGWRSLVGCSPWGP